MLDAQASWASHTPLEVALQYGQTRLTCPIGAMPPDKREVLVFTCLYMLSFFVRTRAHARIDLWVDQHQTRAGMRMDVYVAFGNSEG